MVRILTVPDVSAIVNQIGVTQCLAELVDALAEDFKHWPEFEKRPRISTNAADGVIELMPTCNKTHYAFKYVNGHPNNPKHNKLTVCGTGLLSDTSSGYPLMISEMTIMTALRTAATSALASRYCARPDTQSIGLIGTGAQSEFHALAFSAVHNINEIKYFDIDDAAMKKFAHNMQPYGITLTPAHSIAELASSVDGIITATAALKNTSLLTADMVKPGTHITALGGDCPGKTELSLDLIQSARIIVEYPPQTQIEGEIQQDLNQPFIELWTCITGDRHARQHRDDITIFDSVGFAIEDYTALRYFYEKSQSLDIGQLLPMTPDIPDVKNLFDVLNQ